MIFVVMLVQARRKLLFLFIYKGSNTDFSALHGNHLLVFIIVWRILIDDIWTLLFRRILLSLKIIPMLIEGIVLLSKVVIGIFGRCIVYLNRFELVIFI